MPKLFETELDDLSKNQMYTRREARELSFLLDTYMRFRAEHEGVGYELFPEYYEAYIMGGVTGFFHVSFTKCELLADTEFPEIFQKWKRKH
jgi:hypothetical protein